MYTLKEVWKEIQKFLEEEGFWKRHSDIPQKVRRELEQKIEKVLATSNNSSKKKKKKKKPHKKQISDPPQSKMLKIFADGASQGNPGPAGAGVVVQDPQGNVLWQGGRPLGKLTNNEAEYHALIWALEKAKDYNPEKVEFYVDSQLVARQLKGEYQVRASHLKPLYQKAKQLLETHFPFHKIHHVSRSKNSFADQLAKEAAKGNPKK